MNPMALMKLMSAKNKFNANHPKVGAFSRPPSEVAYRKERSWS